jgi:hypothetical protein
MVHRHVATLLSFSLALVGAVAGPAHAADGLAPATARAVDPAKAKAQELEKQRLLAKLHADAPKLVETRSGTNPLDAPIFHRYDRP